MSEHESPNITLPEDPSSSGRFLRRSIAVASVVVLLLVAGIFGPSWFPDRAAGNLPEDPPQAEPVAPGARPLDATQLMREARSKTWPTEADRTGQIRKGSRNIPFVLYRRDQDIQFQFLQAETRQWQAVHMRQGPADAGPPDLFEMKDGKAFRFQDQKLGESIKGTDITYEDLAMPFLSWPRGTWQEAEKVKGQDCWGIRAQNPGTAGSYALVDLWIHKKTHGLMRMVGYDQQGKALKRMQVTEVTEVGAWGVVNAWAGRSLDRYTIREARIDRYDPVTNKTMGITYLGFDKPTKKTPLREDEAEGEVESVVMTDPLERSYNAEFVDSLDALESADAGDLSEEVPGRLEVTLTEWQRGEEVPYRTSFDTSRQVIGVSIPEDVGEADRRGGERKFSPPLAASMAEAEVPDGFHSAAMLAFKAKQFDDGLYAAVEEAADRGAGTFFSRRKLLADLATALIAEQADQGSQTALGLLGASTGLGGHPVEVPKAAARIATKLEKEFLQSPIRSKPIGFYTWSEDLAGIFRRDRLLQSPLSTETSKAFAEALASDAKLTERYRAALRLPERLTNGAAGKSLIAAAAGGSSGTGKPALFPPSRAYETELIKDLYGDQPIPAGFNLADEMVKRIRSGDLDLQPRDESGWYDYQTHALEPLVIPDRMPEAKHLRMDDSYKKELSKLFKALLALTRETHVKQLESPAAAMARNAMPPPGINLTMSPQLSQEPLATFYRRRALSYRFVRGVLLESFGEAGLAGMKRLTAAGPANLSLDHELRVMESLFYGAYLNTAHELGMTPEEQDDLGLGTAKSLALYRRWNPKEDPDVSRDMRMMVPVFYDVGRQKTKVWVVLGVTTRPLHVRYLTPPKLESIVDQERKAVDLKDVNLRFERAEFAVAYPIMEEIYVTKILNRTELRALCDEHKTQEAILAHLQ